MGIAVNMGLSPAITAGAIISGAYFGDKSSPLSDSTNLAAAAAGADLYEHVRETLLDLVPAIADRPGALLVSGRAGRLRRLARRSPRSAPLQHLAGALPAAPGRRRARRPPLPPFTTIFIGALAGGVLAVVVVADRVIAYADAPASCRARSRCSRASGSRWRAATSATTGDATIDRLRLARRHGEHARHDLADHHRPRLRRRRREGGRARSADHADHRVGEVHRHAGRLPGRGRSSRPTSSPPTSTSPSSCPAGCSRPRSPSAGLAPVVLSRAIGDSGTVTAALIPWNSCGAYMAATLGVATVAYAPFAFFNLL